MKQDTYTKFILTVIATSLVILTFKHTDLIPNAMADGSSTNLPFGYVPVNPDGSVNVRLMPDSEMDVVIKGIETYDELKVDLSAVSTREPIDINIDEVGGSFVSMGGPLKVELD